MVHTVFLAATGRERQAEGTCGMFAAEMGEKGSFPQILQLTACPATRGLPTAQRDPVIAAPQAVPCPHCAAVTPWTHILCSPSCETHVSYLKAEREVRDSMFPPPEGKSRHSKGLRKFSWQFASVSEIVTYFI